MGNLNTWLLIHTMVALTFFSACKDDDVPEVEPEEEIITDVILTFTPSSGNTVVATATDPDGEGPLGIEISETLTLAAETQYSLSIQLENSIAGESITEEIKEEDDEHMFFFAWTEGLFTNPEGNGNIDDRSDVVNYLDFDESQNPLGLETSWTTGTSGSGSFRIILKHQPEIKSNTSTAGDGETDVDLEWDLTIE